MMPVDLDQFEAYRLMSESCAGYWCHNIIDKSGGIAKIETWSRGAKLGRGRFGTVWLEKEKGGALRAVKQIPKIDFTNTRELLALTKMNKYPKYFLQFFGWYEDDENIYFAMEYAQCDLASYIFQTDATTEIEAKTIAAQLLAGLKVMHDNNFCHRDLKPQNILMVSLSPIVVKIGDFGVSKQTKLEDHTALRTETGTVGYIAPEVLGFLPSDTSVYTNAVDVWSLGSLVYAILTREAPFLVQGELLEYVQSRTPFPKAKLVEEGASVAAITFINKLMMPHPDNRLSTEQALRDPWLKVEEQNRFGGGIEEGDTDWDLTGVESRREQNRKKGKVGKEGISSKDTLLSPMNPPIFLSTTNSGSLGCVGIVDETPPLADSDKEVEADSISRESQITLNVDRDTQETLHDCITLYCAVRHQNLRASRRLCSQRQVNTNQRQLGGTTLLHMAAHGGNIEMARLLIENGADITAMDGYRDTALHVAVRKGYEGVTKLLLDNGASIIVRDAEHGPTLLKLAFRSQKERVLLLLLENGADANATKGGSIGDTALYLAASQRCEGMMKLLLGTSMERNIVKDEALLLSVREGYDKIVELLLEKGANGGLKDGKGYTLLNLAVKAGHEKIVRLLLENRGTDGNQHGPALHVAVESGNEGIAKLLLENGKTNPDHHNLALCMAVGAGNGRITKLLLEKGANPETGDSSGYLLLHVAARAGGTEVVRALLEHGAKVNVVDRYCFTALHLAAEGGHEVAVKLLLEYGADVLASNDWGVTAIHLAATEGHDRVVELLLENGADVNSKSGSECTSLFMAIKAEHEKTVGLLLRKGANAEMGSESENPIFAAVGLGNERIARLLLENGANVNSVSPSGWTALCIAIRAGNEEMVELLLEKGAETGPGDKKGYALGLAVHMEHERIMEILLEKGASMETEDGSENTLLAAIRTGNEKVVKLLLEHGADVTANYRDSFRCTALHMVSCYLPQSKRVEMAKVLIAHGALLRAKNLQGQTPLRFAIIRDHKELVELLRRKLGISHFRVAILRR